MAHVAVVAVNIVGAIDAIRMLCQHCLLKKVLTHHLVNKLVRHFKWLKRFFGRLLVKYWLNPCYNSHIMRVVMLVLTL